MVVQYACKNVRRGEGDLKVVIHTEYVWIIEMNHLGFYDFSDE
jgi:hypothetical protein